MNRLRVDVPLMVRSRVIVTTVSKRAMSASGGKPKSTVVAETSVRPVTVAALLRTEGAAHAAALGRVDHRHRAVTVEGDQRAQANSPALSSMVVR